MTRSRSLRRSIPAALACLALLAGMLIALGQRPATAAVGDAVAPSLLKDINPGANSSDPAFFVQKGNELFFLTIGGGAATDGLWKTDGTAAGTQLVKAVNTGGFIGADDAPTPSAHLTLVGDTLFFAAGDKSTGVELWKSDGTEAGTGLVKDLNTGGNLSLPTSFRVLGSKLLFRTTYDSTNGSELWTSDGTDAGTVMVKDINPGSANASPSNVTVVGDTAYFGANDGAHGKELWRTDGTAAGTVMVKDIYPSLAGPFGNTIIGDSDPSNFTALGGSVYFSASDGSDAAAGRHGRELWKTDGTEAGTVMVKDIDPVIYQDFFGPVANSSSPSNLTLFGNSILFQANDGTTGRELWKTDGTDAGTVLVKDINTGATGDSSPVHLYVAGDVVYFAANDGNNASAGQHGYELWKTDGTPAGTVLVKDINPGASDSAPGGPVYNVTNNFAALGSEVYFPADDGTHGIELWKTDGTAAGTVLVKDINPGRGNSSPALMAPALGTLFFSADGAATPTATSTVGVEPWVLGPTTLPTISVNTTASPSVVVGGQVHDTATIAGGLNPTGTITFKLYGPNDSTCSTSPVSTTTATVSGNASYESPSVTTPAAGTFRWTAHYDGDTNNNPAASSCNAPGESVVVTKASPTISTKASAGGIVGTPVRDIATLAGGFNPGATVTYRLFSDSGCGTQVFTSDNSVTSQSATSDRFSPAAPGTYYWTALYNGDGNNNPATSPCNAPNESVVITPYQPPPTTSTITGDFVGPFTVNSGDSVLITGARVVGPVTVNPGGALTVVNSQISRGIVANAPGFLGLCGAQVSAPTPGAALAVSSAAVPIRIGDPAGGCAANRFGGDVNLTANLAVIFGSNTTSGNVTVNAGGPGNTVIRANSIFKALSCADNNPAPTNGGQVNTAASNAGQCSAL